jgi:hypothetical protein
MRTEVVVICFEFVLQYIGAWGSVVVKALPCQSEGLGIDSQWCHWGFFP